MTTFARIVNGFAVDCQVASSALVLAERFHPNWLAANPFVVVPDGTIHGAKDNGNGTFTNPNITPAQIDIVIDRKTARDLVVEVLGGAGAGSAKLQSYIDTANANTATTAAAQNMRYALNAFRTDDSFTKSEAAQIMTGLQFASGDRQAVLNAWPYRVL